MKQQEALLLAREYKSLLLKRKIPVRSVIVFGSAARGTMHEQSDIDIAVIGTAFLGSRHEEAIAVRKARWPISMKIHPIWLPPDYLENRFSTLAHEIRIPNSDLKGIPRERTERSGVRSP